MSVNLYALIESRNGHPQVGLPFYIGIGTAKRPHKHLLQSRSKAGHRNLRLHEVLVAHRELGTVPVIQILAVLPDKAAAGEAEKAAIKRYGRIGIEPYGILCNIAGGGQGPDGELMRMPDVRRRNAAAQKRRPKESFENVIAAGRKNALDPEINARRSVASKAASTLSWTDPEIRAKRIAGMKGKKKARTAASDEARYANAQKSRSAEACAKRSAELLERWSDPAYKSRLAVVSRKTWDDPEKRAAMLAGRSEGISASWQDPETRARRIAGIKAARERRAEVEREHDESSVSSVSD